MIQIRVQFLKERVVPFRAPVTVHRVLATLGPCHHHPLRMDTEADPWAPGAARYNQHVKQLWIQFSTHS